MNLFSKCGITLTGLLVSLGCLAIDPPCWKLESEGAAPGDVCWFSDELTSGTVYAMSKVIMRDGKVYCFHEGDSEDRFIKKFGWFNADRESLRVHFSAQQSIKTFIGSYKWCSDNKETEARPLPAVDASDISEETVNLETVIEDGMEYLSLGLLSSASGQTKRLGEYYKSAAASGPVEKLYIPVYAGCAWVKAGGHNSGRPGWANECFSKTVCSLDARGNWLGGTELDYNNCDGNKNAAFRKIQVFAYQLPENLRKLYRNQH